jgi:two-component system osmolarity sensor histidine kinase EnvZ
LKSSDVGIVSGLPLRRALGYGLAMFFQWLKRYMPSGLYARALLILLLPIVFLQLVVTVLFVTRHFEDVTQQMTAAVGRELRLVMDEVDAAANAASVPAHVIERLSQLGITAQAVDPA